MIWNFLTINEYDITVAGVLSALASVFIFVPIQRIMAFQGRITNALALYPLLAAAIYGSLCLTIYALHHGFSPGTLGPSAHETNRNFYYIWLWITGHLPR